jgi:pyrroline-5-carboxylate reductase
MAIAGRIGFLGGGNMGTALVKGLIHSGAAEAGQIVVAEKMADKAQVLAGELGVAVVAAAQQMGPLDVLLVAVKPLDVVGALQAAAGALTPSTLVISIAAGVKLAKLAEALPAGQRLIRAMPNTPALIGHGVTALAPAEHTPAEGLELAREIFQAVGRVVVVAERLMDAVTGLSASGPAFVFVIIEALSDAGVRVGLDRATALTLAAATVEGAAEMVLATGQHPGQLKDMVTSPGGTTIAGLQVLERAGLRGVLIDVVEAATRRSAEQG